MIKVLFVCWGNICRSPMAEFVFKDMINKRGIADKFHVESRATHTDEIWNGVGSEVYPPVQSLLKEHGISCKGKRAQLLEKADYERYDYIIGMDDLNDKWMHRILGKGNDDPKISLLLDYTDHPRAVADPWYTRDFEKTYQDVIDGCNGFLDYLKGQNLI
ncbi:MAG: low molecular weight phosphotyrosine protein phosphatase [Lachnospiraceae bacterium]|nr:low molecular weight phosphotyrosine protein phosphatase [Lachnospiraceae bacterium]